MRTGARSLLRNRDGVIAVEFGLIAPIMVAMFFGLIELSLALSCRSDVVNLASTGADLVAQESTVTTADMSNVFSALSAMLYPNPTGPAQITITSVVDTGSATSGRVAWSCTQGGSKRAINSTYSFPPTAQGVIIPGGGGSVIMAEVTYNYTSLPAVYITGPITMTNTFYSKPRRVLQIPGPSC